MSRILVQAAAAIVVSIFLWRAFRLAMGLRAARLARQESRRAEEARGRRVVAEVPTAEGELYLFLESSETFEWPRHLVRKDEIVGCRLLLNGAVVATAFRSGAALPEAGMPEEYEGRERWDVRLYSAHGVVDIPCGTLREGVSRDTARAVFGALSTALKA